MLLNISLISIILLLTAPVVIGVLLLQMRRQVKQEQQLRAEAEASKQQIIVEQERNRQLKQEMTSNIAHELKTPVSSILGYLEILLSDKPLDAEKRHYFLERSYSQTIRLSNLINDVALINKLEEADDLFVREELSVRDRAAEAITELLPLAEQHGVTIHNDLPDNIRIQGNSMLLYAIFRNLVENAIMHAGEGVTVGMDCYKPADEGYYYLHFYDTGKGVGNEYLPKLFDRFLRIDEGRSRKNGGTGLGLSIVKHAVLFHHGEIYAKNREEGGLEFFFSLAKKA